ncbi:hypothetical protein JW823_01925 [bacterium]|nr:hypothetical protein [candidate division CSSED10-310 bacterium]
MNNTLSKKPGIAFKSKLTLILFSVGVTLAVLEVFVRFAGFNDQFTRKIFSKNLLRLSDNPALIYELKPGGRSSIDSVENIISSQGLRDREYAIPKPTGIRRIIAIGDSVTYGLGVRAEDTFAKQLEALFRTDDKSRGNKVEILNMGVNGYKTVQEVEHLKTSGLRFEPDIVLLTYNLNDPGDFSRELPYFNSWQNRKWTTESMSLPARFWARLTQYSELAFMIEYRTLRLRLGKVVERKQALEQAQTESQENAREDRRRHYDGYFHLYRNADAMTALGRSLDELQQMSVNNGFQVVFAIFPLLMDFQDYRWLDLHKQIMEMAEQRGFHTVDLLPALKSAVTSATELQRRHDDFEHPNPLGHRIAAETLFGIITAKNLL